MYPGPCERCLRHQSCSIRTPERAKASKANCGTNPRGRREWIDVHLPNGQSPKSHNDPPLWKRPTKAAILPGIDPRSSICSPTTLITSDHPSSTPGQSRPSLLDPNELKTDFDAVRRDHEHLRKLYEGLRYETQAIQKKANSVVHPTSQHQVVDDRMPNPQVAREELDHLKERLCVMKCAEDVDADEVINVRGHILGCRACQIRKERL